MNGVRGLSHVRLGCTSEFGLKFLDIGIIITVIFSDLLKDRQNIQKFTGNFRIKLTALSTDPTSL
ncbi:MAG: hypothetical protein CMM74_04250 [Rhodospirillaceae bacterium]|nr:hypothetical protein [Rhodospirillaceae bacterium]